MIFVRIRGSVFYRDRSLGREMAIKPLLTKLEELEIFPEFEEGDDLSKHDGSVLIDTVKLKATELRLSDTQQLSIV